VRARSIESGMLKIGESGEEENYPSIELGYIDIDSYCNYNK
jgi:hypothetical protein